MLLAGAIGPFCSADWASSLPTESLAAYLALVTSRVALIYSKSATFKLPKLFDCGACSRYKPPNSRCLSLVPQIAGLHSQKVLRGPYSIQTLPTWGDSGTLALLASSCRLQLASLPGWTSCTCSFFVGEGVCSWHHRLFGYDQGVMGGLLDLPSFVCCYGCCIGNF